MRMVVASPTTGCSRPSFPPCRTRIWSTRQQRRHRHEEASDDCTCRRNRQRSSSGTGKLKSSSSKFWMRTRYGEYLMVHRLLDYGDSIIAGGVIELCPRLHPVAKDACKEVNRCLLFCR